MKNSRIFLGIAPGPILIVLVKSLVPRVSRSVSDPQRDNDRNAPEQRDCLFRTPCYKRPRHHRIYGRDGNPGHVPQGRIQRPNAWREDFVVDSAKCVITIFTNCVVIFGFFFFAC